MVVRDAFLIFGLSARQIYPDEGHDAKIWPGVWGLGGCEEAAGGDGGGEEEMDGGFHELIDLQDIIVFPALKYSIAEGIDDGGLGDAAEPEDGVFRVGCFELEIHEV